MTYNHDSINKWVITNFLKKKYTNQLESTGVIANKQVGSSFLQKVLEKYIISGCAEFCHVSALVKLQEQNSWMGFANLKVLLEQAEEKRGLYCLFFINESLKCG